MKNLKYISLILTFAFLGCSDLEEEPIGSLSPEGFFQSPEDIQTMINGAIGNMATEKYWGRKLSIALMLRGDMVTIGDQGTSQARRNADTFQMIADNGLVTGFWPKCYQVIAGTNEAIAAANAMDAPAQQLDRIRAQALFFRAYTYYHLVRLFGDIPYIDAPIVDIEAAKQIKKTPQDEVYQKIIADLQEAKTYLPDQQPTRSLPSKATAAAYLASVYL